MEALPNLYAFIAELQMPEIRQQVLQKYQGQVIKNLSKPEQTAYHQLNRITRLQARI